MPEQPIYISDTNIWIDFSRAGLLDCLFTLPFSFVSSDFFIDELNHPAPNDLLRRGLRVETLQEDEIVELFNLMAEHGNSSLADVSCYLLAKSRGVPLLTGDGRLRRQAMRDGVQVHGSLWLLDQLLAHQIADPAQAVVALEVMLNAGARLPAADCAARLSAWRATQG